MSRRVSLGLERIDLRLERTDGFLVVLDLPRLFNVLCGHNKRTDVDHEVPALWSDDAEEGPAGSLGVPEMWMGKRKGRATT